MAQGYNKTVTGTKAVAPTMNLNGLFNTNYKGTVNESTKYQHQDQSIDINIEEYMDIEIKPEEPKKAWYEELWDAAAEAFSDIGDAIVSTGATIAVGATSILSGVLDVGEHIVDGATWLIAAGADLVGADNAAKSMREFIATDWVDEANKALYENTTIGKAINDASYMKYDSDLAQGIRHTTEAVTEIAAATAATVLTGGGAAAVIAPLALGFASGAGEKAEKVYQQNGTDTNLNQELGIFVSGVGEAANWYAKGKLGANGLKLAEGIKQIGVGNTVHMAGQGFKNTFSTIASRSLGANLTALKNGATTVLKGTFNKDNLLKAFGNTLKDIDTLTDSIGIIGDNAAAWLTGEEEFNKKALLKAGGELAFAYTANLTMNAFTTYLGFGSSPDVTPTTQTGGLDVNIQKYLDDYLLDPGVTPPAGIPQEIVDYLAKFADDPFATVPDDIPDDLIKYLNSKANIPDIDVPEPKPVVDTPPVASSSPSKLSPEVQAILDRLQSRSDFNALEMKNEILASAEGIEDPVLKAKQIYNELNKRLNYSVSYMANTKGGMNATAEAIYNQTLSFANLQSDSVICKGWSDLYRELLIDAGFDESTIKIFGGDNVGSHKWIGIDLGQGQTLVADATNNMLGTTDLFTAKMGLPSRGFVVVDNNSQSFSPLTLYKNKVSNPADWEGWARQLDGTLGTIDMSGYEYEQILQASKSFADPTMAKEVLGGSTMSFVADQVLQTTFPETMDGFEVYLYYRNMLRNIVSEDKSILGNVNPMLYATGADAAAEAISIIEINDGTKTIYQVYSKTLGNIVLETEEQFFDFTDQLKYVMEGF